MPCLIALLAFFLPRVVIAALAIFTSFIIKPFPNLLIPILGFIFMPYTLLAYCYAKNTNGAVDGWYLVLVIVAAIMDLGTVGGGARARGRRSA